MKPDTVLIDLPGELTTERLQLRIPRAGDGFKFVGPLVTASLAELKPWMPWATDPYDPTTSEVFCRTAAANFILRQEVQFLIFTPQRFIGTVGIHHLDWTQRACQIGYWLGTPFVGQGFMSEALEALTAFAFEYVKAVRIEVRCDASNARSRRVAERGGFTLEGTLRNLGRNVAGDLRDGCIYARTEPTA